MGGNTAALGLTALQQDERIGRLTGSRVGAVLGLSRYASSDDVMREMVRQYYGATREFEGNDSTRYGQAHEEDALSAYESTTGRLVLYTGVDQAYFIHPKYEWLAVHPDAITACGVYCEVKCPHRARYMEADDNYIAQMQLGMECARHHVANFQGVADFIVWRDRERLIVKRYEYDPDWLPRNLPALESFIREFREICADPDRSAPYLADKERDDETWRNVVAEWRDAKRQADEAAEWEKRARADLIGLAPQGAKGCGVTVSRIETEGRVDYKRAITQMLPDVDLSAFKGNPSVSYRITESKA